MLFSENQTDINTMGHIKKVNIKDKGRNTDQHINEAEMFEIL